MARMLQVNTSKERVLILVRIGNDFIQLAKCTLDIAFEDLTAIPT